MEKSSNAILILLVLAGMGGIAYLLLRKPALVQQPTVAPPCNIGASYAGVGVNTTCAGLDYLENKVKSDLKSGYNYVAGGVKNTGLTDGVTKTDVIVFPVAVSKVAWNGVKKLKFW